MKHQTNVAGEWRKGDKLTSTGDDFLEQMNVLFDGFSAEKGFMYVKRLDDNSNIIIKRTHIEYYPINITEMQRALGRV